MDQGNDRLIVDRGAATEPIPDGNLGNGRLSNELHLERDGRDA
jgi:hypothetical protein